MSSVFLLSAPAVTFAQTGQPKPNAPPIAQQLVREGDFAVQLLSSLGLGTTKDEVAAESRLGEAGIAPRNGWIGDYPVTPDIVVELQNSVSKAATAGKLSVGKEEAIKRFHNVTAGLGLSVKPSTGKNYGAKPSTSGKFYDFAVLDEYYSEEGPPVVTYYAPPPDYYYLYAWVPYPFWWFDFWLPGFFILRDFHRVIIVNHATVFITNHFNDFRVHRVFRIDPVSRVSGRTFAGIGISRTRGFISTGVPRSDRVIFNGTRTRLMPGGRMPGAVMGGHAVRGGMGSFGGGHRR